jgi:hypothetical protein
MSVSEWVVWICLGIVCCAGLGTIWYCHVINRELRKQREIRAHGWRP